MRPWFKWILGAIPFTLFLQIGIAFAEEGGASAQTGHGDAARILLALGIILLTAKVGGGIFEYFHQPAVIGELVVGVLLGNLLFFSGGHIEFFEAFKTDEFLKVFAEIGVVILLFAVGLETKISDMAKVGVSSLLVALIGVAAPFAIGYYLTDFLGWKISPHTPLFLGATLAATSVGITARVLKDLGRLYMPEAKIILGAAVIDDVVGLIILAVISGIITAGDVSVLKVLGITGKAILFLGLIFSLGRVFIQFVIRFAQKLKVRGMGLIIAVSFAFFLSYLANYIHLATIVGAFAAGIVLDEELFEGFNSSHRVEDMVQVLSDILVPVFFVMMGMLVDLPSFLHLNIVFLALILTVVAVVGKLVCGWGALGKDLDRLAIGIGMIPRGEVGLIFASLGLAYGVVTAPIYSAIVFMVILTTFITPPALKWALARRAHSEAPAQNE